MLEASFVGHLKLVGGMDLQRTRLSWSYAYHIRIEKKE